MRVSLLAAALLLAASHGSAAAPQRSLGEFELRNWDGRAVSRASLRGHTTIVAFTYAKCILACPMITFRLQELDRELRRPGTLRYLHVSVNPEEDTAEEILLHFQKHKIDPRQDPRWMFVNGPAPGLAALLTDLGIQVEKIPVPDGVVIKHTIVVLVLGPDGRTRAEFDTYHWNKKEMLHVLESLLTSSG